jgi:hypothetical protein
MKKTIRKKSSKGYPEKYNKNKDLISSDVLSIKRDEKNPSAIDVRGYLLLYNIHLKFLYIQ